MRLLVIFCSAFDHNFEKKEEARTVWAAPFTLKIDLSFLFLLVFFSYSDLRKKRRKWSMTENFQQVRLMRETWEQKETSLHDTLCLASVLEFAWCYMAQFIRNKMRQPQSCTVLWAHLKVSGAEVFQTIEALFLQYPPAFQTFFFRFCIFSPFPFFLLNIIDHFLNLLIWSKQTSRSSRTSWLLLRLSCNTTPPNPRALTHAHRNGLWLFRAKKNISTAALSLSLSSRNLMSLSLTQHQRSNK